MNKKDIRNVVPFSQIVDEIVNSPGFGKTPVTEVARRKFEAGKRAAKILNPGLIFIVDENGVPAEYYNNPISLLDIDENQKVRAIYQVFTPVEDEKAPGVPFRLTEHLGGHIRVTDPKELEVVSELLKRFQEDYDFMEG